MKATPVKATGFGLLRVIFNPDALPATTEVGMKALSTVMWLSTASVPLTDVLVPALWCSPRRCC